MVWVEDESEAFHRIEIVRGELLRHEVDFLDADAVFARDASSEFNAFVEDVVPCRNGSSDLIWIPLIIEDEGMDVAISCMKDVWNTKIVSATGLGNKLHDLWEFGSRDDAVLGEEVGAESSYRSEGPFSTFP